MLKYFFITSLGLSQLFCNETDKKIDNRAVQSKPDLPMNEVFEITGKLLNYPAHYIRCGDQKIAVGFTFSILESPHPMDEEIVVIIPCPDHFGTGDFYTKGARYEIDVTKTRDSSFRIYNSQEIENLPWLWALKIKKLPD